MRKLSISIAALLASTAIAHAQPVGLLHTPVSGLTNSWLVPCSPPNVINQTQGCKPSDLFAAAQSVQTPTSAVSSYNSRTGNVSSQASDISSAGGLLGVNNLSEITNYSAAQTNLHIGINYPLAVSQFDINQANANNEVDEFYSTNSVNRFYWNLQGTAGETLSLSFDNNSGTYSGDIVKIDRAAGYTNWKSAFELDGATQVWGSFNFNVIPTSLTPSAGDNSTKLATTAFVLNALSGYQTSGSASTTYAPLNSPAFTGTPTAPTAASSDNTTQLATDAFVKTALNGYATTSQLSSYAPLASPALTGTPTVPTASASTNNTQAASTAYTTSAVATETSRATAAEATKAPTASPTFTGTLNGATGIYSGPLTASQLTLNQSGANNEVDQFFSTASTNRFYLYNSGTAGNTFGLNYDNSSGAYAGQVFVVNQTAGATNWKSAFEFDGSEQVWGTGFNFNIVPTSTAPAAGDNSTKIPTTGWVVTDVANVVANYAPLASPALTGTPTVPTAAAGTNTTQVASTAYTTSAVATETSRATTAEGTKAPLASPTFTGTISGVTENLTGALIATSINSSSNASSGIVWYDRTTSADAWQWYATGGVNYLWNNSLGNIFSINYSNGALTSTGAITGSQLTANQASVNSEVDLFMQTAGLTRFYWFNYGTAGQTFGLNYDTNAGAYNGEVFQVDRTAGYTNWKSTLETDGALVTWGADTVNAGITINTSTTTGAAYVNGGLLSDGTAPTLASCGTSPTDSLATDTAGTVTVGTGGTTTCKVTFASAKTNIPTCLVTYEPGGTAPAYAVSTTGISLTFAASVTGVKFDYHCIGH